MAFKDKIKKIRMDACLSQAEFGKLIGLSRFSICNYESGKQYPRFSIIRKILKMAKENKIKLSMEDLTNQE